MVLYFGNKCPNNPLTHRPLVLQMGKESLESVRSLEIFNDDISVLKDRGCIINIPEVSDITLKVVIKSHMMDMKAAHAYLGLGGAYCDLCSFSRKQCHDINQVELGFEITRTVDSLQNIFNDLVQEDGSILKRNSDYDVRGGLTTKPVPTNEVLSLQILHALLRVFDQWMKTNVHLCAEVFDWSESPKSVNREALDIAKKDIQKKILEETGVRWDFPDQAGKGGTTTTGNTARRILHNESIRNLIIEMIPEEYRDTMRQYGQQLSVIIRIVCSNEIINIQELKNLCTELYAFLIRSFPRVTKQHLPGPWISITPSLHKLLAHSWELIELNGERGLRNLDESGLEGNNKILREIRTKLGRKTSQIANLIDSLRRMWLGSDPQVNDIRLKTKPFCKHCKELGHSSRYCKIKNPLFGPSSSDDALFESLILR